VLSNTAVPKYYGRFRQKVLLGLIPVNKEISLQMNRIDELIRNPKYFYDGSVVEGWIKFCENELTLTDGSEFIMLDSFKVWGEDLFGWYEFEERQVWAPNGLGGGRGCYVPRKIKKRLHNKQFLIVGRGAAKTLFDTCVQAYGVIADPTTTDGVTTAPTMKQAEEVLGPLKTAMTRQRGPVMKLLTDGEIMNTRGSKAMRQKLASTKIGIQNFLTNSKIVVMPMDIDKLQGLRSKYNTVDEWLSVDIREDPFTAIEQGASKIKDYIILGTSSEGNVRNGPADTLKMELTKILKNEYKNDHVSIWWYKLDDVSEVANPDMWPKANPNIGITVTYETYQRDVERAEHNPATRNEILAKRFGIPLEGYTYFFTFEETHVHPHRQFWQMPCALGADLSQGNDFCAFTFLFPLPNGAFGVKTRSYISSTTLTRLHASLRDKYQRFMNEGTLVVLDGVVLDMDVVYDDLDNYIEKSEYTVMCLGYDPYNAQHFVDRWCTENSQFGVEKVIQGVKTESVPLGELKLLASERALLFDEELMSWTMGNCVVQQDTNGNRKILKKRREQKIDNVAALMDAWVAYKINKDAFE
jgi:phage terminase large subunit-like protein